MFLIKNFQWLKVKKFCIVVLLITILGSLYGCINSITTTPTATQPSRPKATPFKVEKMEYIQAREQLVTKSIERQGLNDEDVIQSLGSVPRHLFVPENMVDQAYEDHALPIGYGQTISQPSLVAWMTELLYLEPEDKVLEIGTGSGY